MDVCAAADRVNGTFLTRFIIMGQPADLYSKFGRFDRVGIRGRFHQLERRTTTGDRAAVCLPACSLRRHVEMLQLNVTGRW